MSKTESFSQRLIESRTDPGALRAVYAEYLKSLNAQPIWSADFPAASRIPWRLGAEAAEHRSLSDALHSPGLYLFGNSAGVPLYLGMTRYKLWRRLRGRYVCGRRSQCQLAADYQSDLIAWGLEGFPKDVLVWSRQRSNNDRLKGAVGFARHGIDGIWFSLLPFSDREAVRLVEKALIPVANAWNLSHAYAPLLNVQDI